MKTSKGEQVDDTLNTNSQEHCIDREPTFSQNIVMTNHVAVHGVGRPQLLMLTDNRVERPDPSWMRGNHGLTSMMGLEARTFSSTLVFPADPPTVAKKRMAYLADTVFPAPDSPLTMMDWLRSSLGREKSGVLGKK